MATTNQVVAVIEGLSTRGTPFRTTYVDVARDGVIEVEYRTPDLVVAVSTTTVDATVHYNVDTENEDGVDVQR